MAPTPPALPGTARKPGKIDIEIGSRVREARKVKGITQNQLADALGLSFQQVQKYERGQSRVSVNVLFTIAEVLGIEIGDLLESVEPTGAQGDDVDADVARLTRSFRGIRNPAVRTAVLDLVKTMADDGGG